MMKKQIRVVAALIVKDGRFFAAKRAYGFLKGKWELPGGKIESGETPENAIVREISEELSTNIQVEKFLVNIVYEYPEFILDMDVFKCSVLDGRLSLDQNVHLEETFFSKSEFNPDNWCPADKEIIIKLMNTQIL